MFDISESTASAIYNIGNVLIVIAAIAGLLGAIGTIYGGAVGAKFTDIRIENAKADAAKANEGLAKANLDIEDRKHENLQLSLKLEGERSGRAALEKKLSERLAPFNEVRDVVGSFKGMQFFLVSARDDEAKQAAIHLGVTLEYAGWKAVKWTNSNEDLAFGIFVEANDVPANADDQSLEARDALVAWLNKSRILAHGMTPRHELPQGALRISVGRSERLAPAGEVRLKYETILNTGPQDEVPENGE